MTSKRPSNKCLREHSAPTSLLDRRFNQASYSNHDSEPPVMTNSTPNFVALIEDFNQKRQAYRQSFNDYLDSVATTPPTSSLNSLRLDPARRPEDDHVLTDSLGCRLGQRHKSFLSDYEAEEEEHLQSLADQFGDKLPYLKDWLVEFQKKRTKIATMPSGSKEDTATGNITDQVAKESSSSTASDHHTHDVNTGAKEGGGGEHVKATVIDHTSAPGPVQADQLPEKKGKEELKARAAELNK